MPAETTEFLKWRAPIPEDEAEGFTQLCVWENCILKPEEVADFVDFVRTQCQTRVRVVGCVETLPGAGGPGGRVDLLFYAHSEDITKLAARKFVLRMRWWEDVLENLGPHKTIYPQELRSAFPKRW